MNAIKTEWVGFTLHTPTSLAIPGAWGELVLIWEPAAYAEAMRLANSQEYSQLHSTEEKP